MGEWKKYRRTNIAEMRPYVFKEDQKYISISGVYSTITDMVDVLEEHEERIKEMESGD